MYFRKGKFVNDALKTFIKIQARYGRKTFSSSSAMLR